MSRARRRCRYCRGCWRSASRPAVPGREMLTAFVLGYDVAARIAGGFTPRPLAHQNGQVSLLAAAAAGARLRGLDAAGISLRDAHRDGADADAELYQRSRRRDGAKCRRRDEWVCRGIGAGTGARRVRGAARCDRGGARTISSATGLRPTRLSDELGDTWHITRNYFRLYACCNPIHPALDCLAAALAELRPSPDQIERIEVATYRFASVMRNPEPPNYFASKYSLPHAAAVMAVRGMRGSPRSTTRPCRTRSSRRCATAFTSARTRR